MNLDPGFRTLAGIIAQVALVGISVSDLKSEIRITAAARIFEAIFQTNFLLLITFSVSYFYRHSSIVTLPRF